MGFYVLYSFHKQCTFLYISTCAWGHNHTCAISFIRQCIATRCFIPWINQWFSCPFRWSHLFRFYWISRFERIVWSEWFSKSFIKTGPCCHLLVVLLSYLFIHDRPKNLLRCQHKNTLSKILINCQTFKSPPARTTPSPLKLFYNSTTGSALLSSGQTTHWTRDNIIVIIRDTQYLHCIYNLFFLVMIY